MLSQEGEGNVAVGGRGRKQMIRVSCKRVVKGGAAGGFKGRAAPRCTERIAPDGRERKGNGRMAKSLQIGKSIWKKERTASRRKKIRN